MNRWVLASCHSVNLQMSRRLISDGQLESKPAQEGYA